MIDISFFTKQISRLSSQFGLQGKEKIDALFRAVLGEEEKTIADAVDQVLVNCTARVFTKDILCDAISEVREKKWEAIKHEHSRADKNFFSDEQQRALFGALAGAVECGDFDKVRECEENMVKAFKLSPGLVSGCKKCGNSGIVTYKKKVEGSQFPSFEYSFVRKCDCKYSK